MSTPSTPGAARRLVRRLMKPLDGRIADVNRRVADSTESVARLQAQVGALTDELGAYTASATESNAYVGMELREVDGALGMLRDSLETLAERIDSIANRDAERDYVQRLEADAQTPLARLQWPVANLINQASGHRGFAAQSGLWFNPPVTVELSEGTAQIGDVNERIVEPPWAFRTLSRLKPNARILEIGAAESTFALSVASLGYHVTALDLHPLPYAHPNLESVAVRFEDWQAPPEPFDAVFLISTIEHFGLGAYDEPAVAPGADRAAIQRAAQLLADDGFLVLTTPYGNAAVNELERVYDEEALGSLLEGWTVLERQIVARTDRLTWMPLSADPTDAQGDRLGVAMVVALPPHHA